MSGVRAAGAPRGAVPAEAAPAGTAGPPPPERPTVLVLRALGLGDLLTGVPALRALRRHHPGHRLVLAAPEWLRPLVTEADLADELLPAEAPDRQVPAEVGAGRVPPELAVDLHGSGPASLAPLRRTRPERLWGFAAPDGPRWRAREHERERWCRLLRWYGVPADPARLRLPRPAGRSPVPGACLLHPGARAAARRWPPEHFAAVAAALRAAGRPVVITAGPGEGAAAQAVARAAGLGPAAVHAPPLAALSALVAEAAVVVSGDTGVAHLAFAHAVPSVTLYGPVPPAEWGPPPAARHRALHRPGPRGDPHGASRDPLLAGITVDEVLTAVAEVTGAP